MEPKQKAIELRSQFGENAKYVTLEIMDEIKKFGGPSGLIIRLKFWSKVKQELEK